MKQAFAKLVGKKQQPYFNVYIQLFDDTCEYTCNVCGSKTALGPLTAIKVINHV